MFGVRRENRAGRSRAASHKPASLAPAFAVPARSRSFLADVLFVSVLAAMLWAVAQSPHVWRWASGEPEVDYRLANAAANGDLPGVQRALEQGGSPNANVNGSTALMLTQNVAIARLLLAH